MDTELREISRAGALFSPLRHQCDVASHRKLPGPPSGFGLLCFSGWVAGFFGAVVALVGVDGIRAYQESGLSSEFIAIEVYFPLVDNLGAENLRRVLGYGFTQERISLIQTQNIDTKRMDTNFADEFTYVHPAFAW